MFSRRSLLVLLFVGVGASSAPRRCFADWTKAIDCPAGHVYRDVRRDAGREEFCELLLPGFLTVKDGPYRSSFSEGHPAGEGSYENGRQIGRWKECDRFDRCEERNFDSVSGQERSQGIKPEIPVTYAEGKYVFDFGSCGSTWVTLLQDSEPELDLKIGRGLIRCEVTHIPATSQRAPFPRTDEYFCAVPYTVGVRKFDTLDLRQEFVKAGLPQFCRHDSPSPEQIRQPYEDPDFAIRIWVNAPFTAFSTDQQRRAWTIGANTVDVECASIQKQELTVRLNRYAEQLLVRRIGKDEMRADACSKPLALGPLQTERDESGRTLFKFAMSENATTARQQTACIAAQLKLQPTCEAR